MLQAYVFTWIIPTVDRAAPAVAKAAEPAAATGITADGLLYLGITLSWPLHHGAGAPFGQGHGNQRRCCQDGIPLDRLAEAGGGTPPVCPRRIPSGPSLDSGGQRSMEEHERLRLFKERAEAVQTSVTGVPGLHQAFLYAIELTTPAGGSTIAAPGWAAPRAFATGSAVPASEDHPSGRQPQGSYRHHSHRPDPGRLGCC